MKNHSETILKIYDAFGKGDIQTILDQLAEDVHWESWENNMAQSNQVPWLQPRKGKEEVLEFFKIIGEMEFTEFTVKCIMQGDNQVAAEIILEAKIPSTGAILRDEEIHLWTFSEAGKVTRLRHYVDTAKHIQTTKI